MINPYATIALVERYFSLEEGAILSRNRKKTTALARALAMYLIKDVYEYSDQEISDYFMRDRKDVIHNCKKISIMLSNYNYLVTCATIKLSEQIRGIK